MNLSPAERLAYDQLTEAVDNVIRARGWDQDGRMLLTDFLVVAVHQGWDGRGNNVSGYLVMYRDGEMPYNRSLGLLMCGMEQLKRQFNEPDEEDEAP